VSLKSALPDLAGPLDMTTAALYERQRALVRAGLLRARPGRGPGSGVPTDAKSVAMLLISLLATSSLSEVEEWTRIIARMKPEDGVCRFTGKKSFADALAAALTSKNLHRIEVERSASKSWAMGTLKFIGNSDLEDSCFKFRNIPPPIGMSIQTTIWTRPIRVAYKIVEEANK
jgi:hypothetical protein